MNSPESPQPKKSRPEKNENPIANIAFNIIIPVVVLNKMSDQFGANGPTIAVIVALFFPVAYGTYDLVKNKQKNFVSLLGIINILFTGGLALLKMEGIWFAVKEAAFPALIGIIVMITAYTRKPAVKLLAYNDKVMDIDLVEQRLKEKGTQKPFDHHLKKSTLLLSLSFYFSAVLIFDLARYIFVDIDPALDEVKRASVLNEQIADMQYLSFIVIALPLTVFMIYILFFIKQGITANTGLTTEEIFPSLQDAKSNS